MAKNIKFEVPEDMNVSLKRINSEDGFWDWSDPVRYCSYCGGYVCSEPYIIVTLIDEYGVGSKLYCSLSCLAESLEPLNDKESQDILNKNKKSLKGGL